MTLPPILLPRPVAEAVERERRRILAEAVQAGGLMPLLMKSRNGQRWTPEERTDLRRRLRSLTSLAPYAVTLALPASFAVFPLLAWWLDRRRQRRPELPGPGQAAPPSP